MHEPGFNTGTSTNDKPECKEPSNLPFKQNLAGASPVRFSNSNVNAKRPEHSDSQSDPIEFDSRHVHQLSLDGETADALV